MRCNRSQQVKGLRFFHDFGKYFGFSGEATTPSRAGPKFILQVFEYLPKVTLLRVLKKAELLASYVFVQPQ